MTTNLARYKSDLEKLLKLGESMARDIQLRDLAEKRTLSEEERKDAKTINGMFESQYQRWYTESHAVIRQLVPDRLIEFEVLYRNNGKRRTVDMTTYNIQNWLMGIRVQPDEYSLKKQFNDFAAVANRFSMQLAILRAVQGRFESTLFDIRQLVQADVFDSELDAARELAKNGFLRGAGAVVGVVLEKHLAQVAANHAVVMRKQHPTISDLNDALKNAQVIDVPVWRLIQRLGDLRNLADHNKHREPTTEEINELIDSVDKIAKTLF
jgi:hypothetical protein